MFGEWPWGFQREQGTPGSSPAGVEQGGLLGPWRVDGCWTGGAVSGGAEGGTGAHSFTHLCLCLCVGRGQREPQDVPAGREVTGQINT